MRTIWELTTRGGQVRPVPPGWGPALMEVFVRTHAGRLRDLYVAAFPPSLGEYR